MSAAVHRLRRLPPDRVDQLVAAVLFGVAQVECWLSPNVAGQRQETALTAAVATVAVAGRRRAPLTVVAVVTVALTVLALTKGLPNVVFLAPVGVLAVYSLAAYSSAERAVAGLTLALAGLAVGALRTDEPSVTDLSAPAIIFTAAWFVGRSVRARRLRAAELEAHAARVEGESEERERHAAAEERRRIARELHDIVAHRLTTMVIQSESGLAALDDPSHSRRAFEAIAHSGREALSELRRLLGLLRDESGDAATAPQPGLGQLDALLEDTRAAGLPVHARVEGDLAALPPGVDLAAYRIVQEALTNALRHAGTPTTVVVRRRGETVALEIRSALSEGRPSPGSGQGLAGMRERVRVYGGHVTTGPSDGHFVVRATLPVGR